MNVDDEDQAIIILSSLRSLYSSFIETMKYAREFISLEEVFSCFEVEADLE